MLVSLMIVYSLMASLSPQEKIPDAVKKAQAKLEKDDADPEANLTVGAHFSGLYDWEKAVPCLAKAKPDALKSAATLDGQNADHPPFELADAWAAAAPKAGPARQACIDRASYWYAKAWTALNDTAKPKFRQRLEKLYTPTAPGKPNPETLAGWGGVLGAAVKIEIVGQKVHSGGLALKYSTKDGKSQITSSKPVPVTPGKKLECSAWVLADGTDSAVESLKFVIRDAKGGIPWSSGEAIRPDLPVWVRMSAETVIPDGSFSAEVHINFGSKTGALYVDDISIKMDGKELMSNGGFEGK